MKKSLLPFILCAVIVIACSEERSRPEETTPPSQTTPAVQQNVSVPFAPVKPQRRIIYAQSMEPVPTKKLQSLLPDIVAGVRGTEPSTGSLNEEGAHWTTASRDYIAQVGAFTVTLTDFADLQDAVSPFEHEYNIMPADVIGEISHFETPNGRGVIVWDPSKREGKLVFSVNGRFEVRIRTSGLPPDVPSLRAIFDALPVSKLARAS